MWSQAGAIYSFLLVTFNLMSDILVTGLKLFRFYSLQEIEGGQREVG